MDNEIDLEILKEFIAESMDGLLSLDEKFVYLENNPTERANIDAIFRCLHSIKGNSSFFNLEDIKSLSHKLETLLDELRQGKRLVNGEVIDLLLVGTDHLKVMLTKISESPTDKTISPEQAAFIEKLEYFLNNDRQDGSVAEGLLRKISPLLERINASADLSGHSDIMMLTQIFKELDQSLLRDSASPAAAEAKKADETATAGEAPKGAVSQAGATKKTMRIDESTIDNFMNYVGELIGASEVFNNLQKKIESENINPAVSKEFKNANLSFNILSNNLQKSIAEIRKVPLRNLLSKIPRLIRELSQSLSKEIDFKVMGEDIMIDKSLIESLEDPLVHMIRNSLDHGIETPDKRLKKGKEKTGKLTIEGRFDKHFFYLYIRDDGAGIDPAFIRTMAVKKGVLSQESANEMSEKEVINLIFAPGFSTAEQISQVSGRGVGMDVVLTNIKRANGTVEIDSAVDVGTSICIKLPLTVTLIVVSGLVVQIGKEYCIVPAEHVKEVARPKEGLLSSITGRTRVVTFRNKVFPMYDLNELFGPTPEARNIEDQVMVLIEKDSRQISLLVDKLLGLQQVVMKNIGDEFKRNRTVSGGAILGNGRVGLILDVKGLLDRYHSQQSNLHA